MSISRHLEANNWPQQMNSEVSNKVYQSSSLSSSLASFIYSLLEEFYFIVIENYLILYSKV